MANSKQSKKRARQNVTRRNVNVSNRSAMRTFIKNVRKAIDLKDKEQATLAQQKAVPVIDKMVNKGIIHANTAARYKSRLNRAVKSLSA